MFFVSLFKNVDKDNLKKSKNMRKEFYSAVAKTKQHNGMPYI